MTRPDADPAGPREPAPQASRARGSSPPDAPPAAMEGEEAEEAATDMEGGAVGADRVDSERIADLEDRLRRALADADNARKRCARQVTDARADERMRVAVAWLPIVDNLERALEHAEADSDAIIEGIRVVREQAVSLLRSLGFPRHDEIDVPFDPQVHEAVSVVPDGDARAGTVLQVLRPGYGEGPQQLRPAAVVVAGGTG